MTWISLHWATLSLCWPLEETQLGFLESKNAMDANRAAEADPAPLTQVADAQPSRVSDTVDLL